MLCMLLVVEHPDAVVSTLYNFCSVETPPGDAINHVVMATEDLDNSVFLNQ